MNGVVVMPSSSRPFSSRKVWSTRAITLNTPWWFDHMMRIDKKLMTKATSVGQWASS